MAIRPSSSTTRIFFARPCNEDATADISIAHHGLRSRLKGGGKTDLECRAGSHACGLQMLNYTADLAGQRRHQLEPQAFGLAEIETRPQPHPIIGEQKDKPVLLFVEPKQDGAFSLVWKSVFQGVGEQFVEDEAAGNSVID